MSHSTVPDAAATGPRLVRTRAKCRRRRGVPGHSGQALGRARSRRGASRRQTGLPPPRIGDHQEYHPKPILCDFEYYAARLPVAIAAPAISPQHTIRQSFFKKLLHSYKANLEKPKINLGEFSEMLFFFICKNFAS
jgi:hypothetical protein